jgi:hypothetical protein
LLIRILTLRKLLEAPLNCLNKIVCQCRKHKVSSCAGVEQEKHEVLPIPKTDAVVDPGTVVVHVEDTPIALRTVVAALWLKNIAH